MIINNAHGFSSLMQGIKASAGAKVVGSVISSLFPTVGEKRIEIKFAWLPKKLDDGHWVFLRKYKVHQYFGRKVKGVNPKLAMFNIIEHHNDENFLFNNWITFFTQKI